MQLYGLDMGRDQFHRQYVRCQVTQEVMVSGATVAAHLFPKSYRVSQLLRFSLYRQNAAMPLDCIQFTSAAMLHIGQSCAGFLALLLKGVDCSYCSTLFLQPEEAVSFGVLSPGSDVRNGLVWFAGIEEVNSGWPHLAYG